MLKNVSGLHSANHLSFGPAVPWYSRSCPLMNHPALSLATHATELESN